MLLECAKWLPPEHKISGRFWHNEQWYNNDHNQTQLYIKNAWQLHSQFIETHGDCAGFFWLTGGNIFIPMFKNWWIFYLHWLHKWSLKPGVKKVIMIILLMIVTSISATYSTFRRQQKWYQSTLQLLQWLLLEKPQYYPVFITSDMIHTWTLPTTGDGLKTESNEYAWLQCKWFCDNMQLTVTISTVMYEVKGIHPSIFIIKTKLLRWNDRWHECPVTRITQEWTTAVWALGFVLILWDLICGIRNGPWTLTKPDCFIHLTITQWHHSPSSSSWITNDGSLLQQTEPHHPSKTTSSSSKKVHRGTYRYLVSIEPEIFTCTHTPYTQGCTDSGKPW